MEQVMYKVCMSPVIFFVCNIETRYKNKSYIKGRKNKNNVLYFKCKQNEIFTES